MQDVITSYDFLIHLDTKTLTQFCNSSSYYNKLCHSVTFWEYKFKKENLPLFTPYPNTLSLWILKYNQTKFNMDIAFDELLYNINDIISQTLYQNDTDPTEENGDIVLYHLLTKLKDYYKL